MKYKYDKIVVKSVEQFYKKICNGYIFENIGLAEEKKKDLYNFILMQKDSLTKQICLGDCYYYGYGISKDLTKAIECYTKAANQGDAKAQYNLGLCYYYGQGVSQDYEKAFHWYEKAANQETVLWRFV